MAIGCCSANAGNFLQTGSSSAFSAFGNSCREMQPSQPVETDCDPAFDPLAAAVDRKLGRDTGRSIVDSDLTVKPVAQASQPLTGIDGQLRRACLSAELRTARTNLRDLLLSDSDDPAPDTLSEPPCTCADFQQARNYLRLILSCKPGASAGSLQRTIQRRAKLKNAFTDLADLVHLPNIENTCTRSCAAAKYYGCTATL